MNMERFDYMYQCNSTFLVQNPGRPARLTICQYNAEILLRAGIPRPDNQNLFELNKNYLYYL